MVDKVPLPKCETLKVQRVNCQITKLSSKAANKNDKHWQTVQNKLIDVMGPLCTIWKLLESNDLDKKMISTLIQKAILIAGQTNQMLSYYRRYELLAPILSFDKREINEFLRINEKRFIKTPKELFERKDMAYLRKNLKSDKSTGSRYFNKPFRGGHSSSTNQRNQQGGWQSHSDKSRGSGRGRG
ncbi:unnamed protein product [Owenia fusiformis]|uniref:Uncharacterized protein n=1 Tax=Owenia fusiformis TaxID=6347 RepID=A0A8S4PAD2_OWEFU|nr:unnamed protein product [Owenia fusiformis]